MYGMVNKAVEDLVVSKFGEPTWEKIKSTAGVEVDVFVSNDSYPDELTYKLVGAASKVLNVPAATVLELFGQHWVLKTAREGYGDLLEAGGKTLSEFLVNLPNFHSRVVLIFPALDPPRFECTEVTASQLRLHYFSHRAGLSPFVVGLLKGLGGLFQTEVAIEHVAARDNGADHDEFLVRWSRKGAA